MAKLALALGFGAMLAAGLPFWGLYLALGLGIAAIGCGVVGWGRRQAPGALRLVSAAAITVGTMGLILGMLRFAVVIGAIDRIERMLG
jgi:hypothetical protein